MRRSTQLLSVALLASIVVAAWLWITLESERARNAELNAKIQSIEGQQSVDAPLEVESPASAPAPAETPPISGSQPAIAAGGASAAMDDDAGMSRERQLLRNPDYREAARAQMRLGLSFRRNDFIRILGFTPEQADAAVELEIDERLHWTEDATNNTTSPEGIKEAEARYEVFKRAQQERLKALVGAAKQAKHQEYLDSWPTRRLVENLRTDLGEANALRDDQVEALVAALHVEQSKMTSNMQEYRQSFDLDDLSPADLQRLSDRGSEEMKSMHTRMVAAAASVMTNAQLAVLKERLRGSLEHHEASKRLGLLQRKLDQANAKAAN